MFGWEGSVNLSAWRSGGFTPAARKLGVSVAQVSRQVAQLEDRLQAKLLLRTTRRVRLTELGEDHFRHCRQLLDNLTRSWRWDVQAIAPGSPCTHDPGLHGEPIAPW